MTYEEPYCYLINKRGSYAPNWNQHIYWNGDKLYHTDEPKYGDIYFDYPELRVVFEMLQGKGSQLHNFLPFLYDFHFEVWKRLCCYCPSYITRYTFYNSCDYESWERVLGEDRAANLIMRNCDEYNVEDFVYCELFATKEEGDAFVLGSMRMIKLLEQEHEIQDKYYLCFNNFNEKFSTVLMDLAISYMDFEAKRTDRFILNEDGTLTVP